MTVLAPFMPAFTQGITVAPGTSSATSTIGAGSKSLCLTNFGSVTCYVRAGFAGISATTADYPVLPNTQVTIEKFQDFTTVAYITASGTGSLHIMPGEGF
jgi:hypothetical protein